MLLCFDALQSWAILAQTFLFLRWLWFNFSFFKLDWAILMFNLVHMWPSSRPLNRQAIHSKEGLYIYLMLMANVKLQIDFSHIKAFVVCFVFFIHLLQICIKFLSFFCCEYLEPDPFFSPDIIKMQKNVKFGNYWEAFFKTELQRIFSLISFLIWLIQGDTLQKGSTA